MDSAVMDCAGCPRVSVLMAVRNCEPYLRACVGSLTAQFFTSFEIIIVDDGSTDTTSEVLDELINANPSLAIKNARNLQTLGIAASRNLALSAAAGEYAAVMDGDDLCRPDRLAQQAGFLDVNPSCFCVGSAATRISANGTSQGILDYGVRTHEQIVERFLAGCNPIINSSTMFRRRKAMQTLGGYKIEGPAAIVEDLDFWYRAILAGLRFQVLPDPLVFYRSNPSGHTHTRTLEIQQAHQLRLGEFRRDFKTKRHARIDGIAQYVGETNEENAQAWLAARAVNMRPRPNSFPNSEGTRGSSQPFSRRSPCAPIRAAFLTPILYLGGAEQWILSLVKRCDPSRLRCTGIALTDQAPVHAAFCHEVATHVPIYGANTPSCESVTRCSTTREALLAVVQEADVLIIWGLWNIRSVIETVGIPIVYVSHGSGDWAVNCACGVENEPIHLTAVSEAARSSFSEDVRRRVRVIHNGIEVDRCTPNRSRANVRTAWGFGESHRLVGYAGRYSGEKNPIAAALAVTRLSSDFYAVYAGAGLHESSVRSIAQKTAGDRARFVPPDRRIGNLMQAFDVMVMASSAEGFSLLVAEAWYCGVPVVSTRVGAIPELEAAHGELVSVVPISPTAEELAGAVEKALSAEFRRHVVPRAQALVAEQFTATRMAERWTDYLLDVCAERERCAEPSP